jgi:NAD(P)-dependent dehydrogenase (short-subunit alcohol dehydrogenase family)
LNVFITGANRGFGFRLVVRAAERGCTVHAAVRNAVLPNPGSIALSERYPGKVLPDLTDGTRPFPPERFYADLRGADMPL